MIYNTFYLLCILRIASPNLIIMYMCASTAHLFMCCVTQHTLSEILKTWESKIWNKNFWKEENQNCEKIFDYCTFCSLRIFLIWVNWHEAAVWSTSNIYRREFGEKFWYFDFLVPHALIYFQGGEKLGRNWGEIGETFRNYSREFPTCNAPIDHTARGSALNFSSPCLGRERKLAYYFVYYIKSLSTHMILFHQILICALFLRCRDRHFSHTFDFWIKLQTISLIVKIVTEQFFSYKGENNRVDSRIFMLIYNTLYITSLWHISWHIFLFLDTSIQHTCNISLFVTYFRDMPHFVSQHPTHK